jgi:hypothetical protein
MLSVSLRKHTQKSVRKVRGWVLRTWVAKTQPRILELVDHTGTLEELQRAFATMIARDGVASAVATASAAFEYAVELTGRQSAIGALHIGAIRELATIDLKEALRFGDAHLAASPGPRSLHTLGIQHKRAGRFERALELLDRIGHDPEADETITRSRIDARFETALEIELREIAATIATDEAAARARSERMLAVEDDHELAILCNLLVREVQTQKEPRLRELFLARLDELNARPSLPPETACRLSAAFLRLGLLKKARHALDLGAGTDERTEHQRRELDELDELGSRGFTYDKRIADYTPIPKRLLYVLHSSLPHHSSGYATRTHGLLGGIAGQGWQASGVTRLGYPQDLGALAKIPIEPHSIVDGVAYHRLTRSGPLFNSLPKCGYLRDYADALCELAKRERPQILHAAADFHNGLACTAAARALGIKSIYEVRGLWEITRGSREPEWMESEYFAMSTALEAQAARDADAVVVITRALGDEMVRRGVPREKITLIPNGVDVGRFIPRPRDQALADRLGLRNKRVIGYVGSIVDYEGLDLLMHAMQLVAKVNGSATLVTAPRNDLRLFVLEQRGAIRIVDNNVVLPEPFLDLSADTDGPVICCGENGLLGLAFHPQYATNGTFFVTYTARNTGDPANPQRDVLARCQVSADPNKADRSSCVEVLSIPDFAANHNGGMIEFGPDGYLYWNTGDGGGGGDPQKNGQALEDGNPLPNTHALLAKMLRLDVDVKTAGLEYGIPGDNPFASGGGKPEIFMIGLRNAWRWTFDRNTGDMWIADVGQNRSRRSPSSGPSSRTARTSAGRSSRRATASVVRAPSISVPRRSSAPTRWAGPRSPAGRSIAARASPISRAPTSSATGTRRGGCPPPPSAPMEP